MELLKRLKHDTPDTISGARNTFNKHCIPFFLGPNFHSLPMPRMLSLYPYRMGELISYKPIEESWTEKRKAGEMRSIKML